MRSLLLVSQGSRLTATLVEFLRGKGFEPFVLSSAAPDGGAAFDRVCAKLGVGHAMSGSVNLSAGDVLGQLRDLPGCAFCFSVFDEQRDVMARANEVLGAHDASPQALELALDKHLMRRRLVERGLSELRPFLLSDPALRERLDRGERHIVKPRRGAGSLCTRVAASWAEVAEQVAAFERGPGEGDGLAAYFAGNELIAETFIDGRELSFEIIRQDGRTRFAIEHEKTQLDFTAETVLERAFASPPVGLTAAEVDAAREHMDRALSALGLDAGCYHVELRVASGQGGVRCELIEVNPRVGGGYIYDSVRLQTGRSLGDDWVDVLAGTPVAPTPPRGCGAYYQSYYPQPGRQVLGVERDESVPEPAMFAELCKPGATLRADREDKGAQALWTTGLAGHADQVAALEAAEYVKFVYAKGLTGRPLFLVFEPTNHIHQVIEAADRLGHDVVVFHTLPFPASGPYSGARSSVAASHLVDSWTATEACLDQVLAACGGAPVAGTYAGQEVTLPLEGLVQEHFGLPGKGSAAVRELLDKVNVRRRLTEAGLTKLRYFEQDEARALGSWPVGDRALYFKPVHGAASAFVRRCTDLDQVREAISEWSSADRGALPVLGPHLETGGGAFFLEEEAVGELLSVEGYVHGDRYHLIGLTSRVVLARDIAVEMGSTYPYDHPRHDEIVDLVARVHAALGIAHGPTHTELIVPPDGAIELVELNLRFAGGDALAAMNLAHDVRLEDDLVVLATGGVPSQPLPRRRFTCLHELLAPRGLRRLESIELPSPQPPFVKIFRGPGELASTDRQIDHIASFVVCGDTYDEAFGRALDVRRRALVNGEPLADDPNNVVIGR
ncbi:MAG TPA: ATP-grasp domain-containing protein [Pseudonocardiaceae bacterium]|nr:ATP-grasp domain-containing protein [Pseudonocardiaceae bacterium]